MLFLANKNDCYKSFQNISRKNEIKKDIHIREIRSDYGGEFENTFFYHFYTRKGISHEFFFPRTPQPVERENRTLQKMA